MGSEMLDQTETQTQTRTGIETYDLVVIGAGIAGLNALNAASEYLAKGASVLLLDQKDAPGGMWNTAYDYVRLHQPHPMFTVGNMKWDWRKPRDYLAARDEVQSHLARALAPIAAKVDLQTAFGQTVTGCAEIDTPNGPMAEVTFHPNGTSKTPTTVRANRAIHASGLNYELAQPLAFTSQNVLSIIPQDLRQTLATHPDAPVVVVGGGKTGMDTVLATLAADPTRHVSLIKGRGTNFVNRTKYIPTGLKRWTSGELVSRLFRDLALQFDGDNEDDTIAHFRKNHSTDPGSQNGVFLYGLQSEDEHARITAGLSATLPGYVADVVDGAEGPCLSLRDGASVPIEAGSLIVNCTGSFFRAPALNESRSCLSPKRTIVSIGPRDGMHFLTSVAGFFMIHMLYRDVLENSGIYTLDHEALFRQNRNVWVGASSAQAYLNQVIAVQTLPMMLLDRCGLDLDRWYPLPRRMAGLMRMKASAKSDIAHCRRAIDRVAERFDIHAGPVV